MSDDDSAICDICSENPASFWCESCSELLCKEHVTPHQKQNHEVSPLNQEGEGETEKEEKQQSEPKKSVSEDRFLNVLSMLENSSPQTICRGLIRQEFSTTKEEYRGESHFNFKTLLDENNLKNFFTSLAENSFAVIDDFVSITNEEILDDASSISFVPSLINSNNDNSNDSLGQRGDFVFKLKNSDPHFESTRNSIRSFSSSFLSKGVKSTSRTNLNEHGTDAIEEEIWKFSISDASQRNKIKDSIPNNGSLEGLKGMLSRRVSIVVFLNDSDEFLWNVHLAEEVKQIDVKKGRALIFLSGAVATQITQKNKHDPEQKDLFCCAAWLR
jgi:hypothetical protein